MYGRICFTDTYIHLVVSAQHEVLCKISRGELMVKENPGQATAILLPHLLTRQNKAWVTDAAASQGSSASPLNVALYGKHSVANFIILSSSQWLETWNACTYKHVSWHKFTPSSLCGYECACTFNTIYKYIRVTHCSVYSEAEYSKAGNRQSNKGGYNLICNGILPQELQVARCWDLLSSLCFPHVWV